MGVDHGGFGLGVAEQFLYVANVDPLLEQVGGVGMPQGVWGNGLNDAVPFGVLL